MMLSDCTLMMSTYVLVWIFVRTSVKPASRNVQASIRNTCSLIHTRVRACMHAFMHTYIPMHISTHVCASRSKLSWGYVRA